MGEFNDVDNPIQYTVDDAIKALDHDSKTFSVVVSYGLSDLSVEDIEKVKNLWKRIDSDSKQRLVRHLVDLSESNFELNYHQLAFLLIHDEDEIIREAAIELMWENESIRLLHELVRIAEQDEIASVRAVAITTLGRFILMGEYDKLAPDEANRLQDIVINIWNNNDEDIIVRKRALEAISNSSNEVVSDLIEEAYHSDIHEFVVSAVYAMGKSYDSKWEPIVLKLLSSTDAEIQYEAIRACGELEIEEAIHTLINLAISDDREIQEIAIWSIGEIGGSSAIQALNKLIEDEQFAEDELLFEALEDALGNASVVDEMLNLSDFSDVDNFM